MESREVRPDQLRAGMIISYSLIKPKNRRLVVLEVKPTSRADFVEVAHRFLHPQSPAEREPIVRVFSTQDRKFTVYNWDAIMSNSEHAEHSADTPTISATPDLPDTGDTVVDIDLHRNAKSWQVAQALANLLDRAKFTRDLDSDDEELKADAQEVFVTPWLLKPIEQSALHELLVYVLGGKIMLGHHGTVSVVGFQTDDTGRVTMLAVTDPVPPSPAV